MTYSEIHARTGEAEPVVHVFSLPPRAAAALGVIPGFEDYDEKAQVLKCIKPCTGTKDAPRALSLKLAVVTQPDSCRMCPTTMDKELEIRHALFIGGHASQARRRCEDWWEARHCELLDPQH